MDVREEEKSLLNVGSTIHMWCHRLHKEKSTRWSPSFISVLPVCECVLSRFLDFLFHELPTRMYWILKLKWIIIFFLPKVAFTNYSVTEMRKVVCVIFYKIIWKGKKSVSWIEISHFYNFFVDILEKRRRVREIYQIVE